MADLHCPECDAILNEDNIDITEDEDGLQDAVISCHKCPWWREY